MHASGPAPGSLLHIHAPSFIPAHVTSFTCGPFTESKAWEVDTLRGHTNNVSCIMFHARQVCVRVFVTGVARSLPAASVGLVAAGLSGASLLRCMRHPCLLHAAPMSVACGTHVCCMRHPCPLHAAPMSVACGTHAGRPPLHGGAPVAGPCCAAVLLVGCCCSYMLQAGCCTAVYLVRCCPKCGGPPCQGQA